CAGSGSPQVPDGVGSVGSRVAIGPPQLLGAPLPAAGLLPARRVARASQAGLGAPRTACRASSDCGAALDAAVPRRPPGPLQALPACDVQPTPRAPPNTPAPAERCACPFIPAPCPPAQGADTVGRGKSVFRGSCVCTAVAARGLAFTVPGHLSRS